MQSLWNIQEAQHEASMNLFFHIISLFTVTLAGSWSRGETKSYPCFNCEIRKKKVKLQRPSNQRAKLLRLTNKMFCYWHYNCITECLVWLLLKHSHWYLVSETLLPLWLPALAILLGRRLVRSFTREPKGFARQVLIVSFWTTATCHVLDCWLISECAQKVFSSWNQMTLT